MTARPMARDPHDPHTLDMLSPAPRTRRKSPVRAKTATQRAAAYRDRLKAQGGARITFSPQRSALVREALRFALKNQDWEAPDAAELRQVIAVLRKPPARKGR